MQRSDWAKYAKPGDKIVALRGKNYLKPGKVYTIEAVYPPFKEEIGIGLVEIKSKRGRYGAFMASLFRPLIILPTSISIFTEMLNKVKINATQ